MSILCNLYYTVTENGKQRLVLGSELKKLLLARYKAQQHIFRFQNELKRTGTHAESIDQIRNAEIEARQKLEQMKKNMKRNRDRIRKARNDVAAQMETVASMAVATDAEKDELQEIMAEAERVVNETDKLGEMDFEQNGSRSGDPGIIGETEADGTLRELSEKIREIESELEFIERFEHIQPAAMALVEAMRKNGYSPRDIISREGLVSYFEQKDTGRVIAVRISERNGAGDDGQTWELLTETFGMQGEDCLMEIEDFETSLGEKGRVSYGTTRVYPKNERSMSREKRGVLPSPRTQVRKKRIPGKNKSVGIRTEA